MIKGYLSKIRLEAVSLMNLSVKRLELISLVDSLVQIKEEWLYICVLETLEKWDWMNVWIFAGEANEYTALLIF